MEEFTECCEEANLSVDDGRGTSAQLHAYFEAAVPVLLKDQCPWHGNNKEDNCIQVAVPHHGVTGAHKGDE